ncbi:DNA cytosine methyltransferase [Actinomadura sp. NPDC049382]|uniref:DNA cytosine methyltransferase n=1 Tax=Actinomadura sp. NPDC049382 TaxID=3158220 RepID=UPI003447F911
MTTGRGYTSLEICAGAGGLALGLEGADFHPVMLFDEDANACATLRENRPKWNVRQLDLFEFVGHEHRQVLDVDLLAGGLPRPRAGRRESEQRDPLHAAVWLATEVRPRAIFLENTPGLVTDDAHADVREFVEAELGANGYACAWRVLDAQDYGVPQRRPHGVLVAMSPERMARFEWPASTGGAATVGDVLWRSMASRGWAGALEWRARANEIAPTIVGGSKDRGGADLGPTGSKKTWARLGVNGGSIADDVPGPDFRMSPELVPKDRSGLPKLTVEQVALLQGFPPDWKFAGRKTARYRQVGHAMPPPLAEAVGRSVAGALG